MAAHGGGHLESLELADRATGLTGEMIASRLDSMERGASAVGEDAMAVYLVHRCLGNSLMHASELRGVT
jgi:hypothetical protein